MGYNGTYYDSQVRRKSSRVRIVSRKIGDRREIWTQDVRKKILVLRKRGMKRESVRDKDKGYKFSSCRVLISVIETE